jgi:GGDEF domain-containing protein
MNILITIGILVVWLIFNLVLVLAKKTKGILRLFINAFFIVGLGVVYFVYGLDSTYMNYYSIFTLVGFGFHTIIEILILRFKGTVSEYDYYNLEKEFVEMSDTSELLRNRFISTIELLNDGISFRDEDGYIFGSDKYIEYLGLENNEFSLEIFENIIHKDDLYQYRETVQKADKKNPFYHIDYRVNINGDYLWIKERGKRILLNKKISYISIIKRLNIKQFPETEIDVLNELEGHKKLYEELQKLSRYNKPYHLAIIKLTNVPKINEKYGREVGDLMMGDYIKKMQYNFIKDNEKIYRITGIDFAIIIRDEKKYQFLERALTGGGDLLNLNMIFGGITQTLYPNIGLSESLFESKTPDQVLEEALKALEISLKDSTNKNYCFYDKI